MSLNIVYWESFSKKMNSTKQPATAGTTITAVLKENCSIEQPVFILTGVNSKDITYVQAFSNYYFVDDKVFTTSAQCELHCSIDAMGTYKTAIGSSKQFIMYSESAFDTTIPDTRVIIKPKWQHQLYKNGKVKDGNGNIIITTYGYYALTVMSCPSSGTNVGMIATYALTPSQFRQFATEVFDGDSAIMSDLINVISHRINNIFECIIDCRFIPCPILDTDTLQPIRMASVDLETEGYLMQQGTLYNGAVEFYPSHYYNEDDFRSAIAERFDLTLPMYGIVPLNPEDFSAKMYKIYVNYRIDVCTGNAHCRVCLYDDLTATLDVIKDIVYDLSIPVPIVHQQIGRDGSAIGTVASALVFSGMVLSGNVVGAVAAGAAMANGIVNMSTSTFSQRGSVGSWATITDTVGLNCYYRETTEPDDLEKRQGRPLFQYKTISTLSGFVQCGDASIDIASTTDEKQTIENYMNNGFYYE